MGLPVYLQVAGVLAALLLWPRTAQAGVSWCEEDPILHIADTHLHIVTAVPRDRLDELVGDVLVQIVLPYNHPPAQIEDLSGQYYREDVLLVEGDTPWQAGADNRVEVTVLVRARKVFPIQVRVWDGRDEQLVRGRSNMTVTVVAVVR